MKKDILFGLTLFSFFPVFSQDIRYDALSIPEKLKTNAHVVKRFEEIQFEVSDIDDAKYKVHQVYTVLDKQGASTLFFSESENKFDRLTDVDIKVYNVFGTQVGKYRKKDLVKRASLGNNLVDDNTYYFLDLDQGQYPVTVEFMYEFEFSGTMFYPSYTIIETDESVERSSYTAKVPADLDLRYYTQKTSITPAITMDGKYKVYTWQVKDLEAVSGEYGAVSREYYNPEIILAPNKFRLYNTEGDMRTWKSFGMWSYQLYSGLEELPDERIQYFKSLVKNAPSEREKVAILYKYLQDNFRYVSIQLRIGGWKPFPAKFTDDKKYGDCKGLSLYMHAMLKAVGIKSHVAIINAQYNKQPVDPSFPVSRFNHVIVCVPQAKDSIWLECTSNIKEFGVLGTFTENRNALLVTEQGGVLVTTPASRSANNILSASTYIELFDDGSGKLHTITHSKGQQMETMQYLVNAKKDDQKEFLVNEMGFKQPDEFTVTKNEKSVDYNVDMDMVIEKIPQFTAGSKMFLNQRVYRIFSDKLPKSEGRKQDFYFQSPFVKLDTTFYRLPENYVVDILPKTAALDCAYASYKTDYKFDGEKNQLMSIARLELKHHIIPADKYGEVKTFFDKISADESQKIIIRKN